MILGKCICLIQSLIKSGNNDDATFYFESALLADENNSEALLKLGSLYLQQNKVDYAYGHLLRASEISPSDAEISAKLNEALVIREKQNKDREEIEINYIELGEISNSLLEYYNNNLFGTITLFNTQNIELNNIIVMIECEQLGTEQAFVTIYTIEPNEYSELSFMFNIDKAKYEIAFGGKSEIVMKFTIKHKDSSSANKVYSQTKSINLTN